MLLPCQVSSSEGLSDDHGACKCDGRGKLERGSGMAVRHVFAFNNKHTREANRNQLESCCDERR